MKRNFNQPNLPSAETALSLSAYDSFQSVSLAHCSLFIKDCLTSEQQLRTCVKEKASQGDYAVAIALLDQLIALHPDNAVDYNNRGLMYYRNNQIIEALCDLSQALAINPHLDSAYNNRANCHAAQGELSEAPPLI